MASYLSGDDVLPQGFSKVRHYGLFSPSRHDLLALTREQLITASASPPPPAREPIDPAPVLAPEISPRRRGPACGIGVLHLVETLLPCGRSP